MDGRHSQKRCEAGPEPLPADDQPAVLFLKPGKRPLGLEGGHVSLDRSPSWGLGLPDPLGNLGPDAPGAELLAQRVGVIAFVGHDDLQALPGAPTRAGPTIGRDVRALQAEPPLPLICPTCGLPSRLDINPATVTDAPAEIEALEQAMDRLLRGPAGAGT